MLPQDNVELPVYAPSPSEPMNNLDLVGGAHTGVLMTAPSSPHRNLHRNIFGAGKSHLVSHPWCIFPHGVSSLAEPAEGTSGDDNSVEFIGEVKDGSDVRNGAGPSSSTSSSTTSRAKEIIFNIHHNYQTQQIKISDHATLGEFRLFSPLNIRRQEHISLTLAVALSISFSALIVMKVSMHAGWKETIPTAIFHKTIISIFQYQGISRRKSTN